MKKKIFDETCFNVSGKNLDLCLIDVFEPENSDLPFYWWDVIWKSENKAIGIISLRLGESDHSYNNDRKTAERKRILAVIETLVQYAKQ